MKSIVDHVLVLLLLTFGIPLYAEPYHAHTTSLLIPVAEFSKASLADWQEEVFAGHTIYRLTPDTFRQKTMVLKAHSQQSASGLFKKVSIDLNKTPYLNWSWKTDSKLGGLNERTKSGDDYTARIYVIKKHALLFWKTRALNYVWSSNQARGSQWDNAYTGQAKMLAVRGQDSPVGQWLREKRNVKNDLKLMFGEDINHIDVVAIMTDTDNSGRSATAWYGDIYFSAE